MSLFANIQNALADFMKYAAIALPAVQAAETEIGPGNGETKAQLAIAAVLAVAHAGETVPVEKVQLVSAVVDTIVSTLNATGVFTKSTPVTSVAVPAVVVVTDADEKVPPATTTLAPPIPIHSAVD